MKEIIKENKMIIFGCIIAALFFFFLGQSYAGEYHHSHSTNNNYYSTQSGDSKGVAAAISAAQCHFDGGSFDLQLCSGAGFSDNSEAATFGVGKKYKEFLINGTITTEDNKSTLGVGLNWKIK